ncbi:Nn.00g036830.m01.CDS01 [Neocucurbitaria sp. VM-36]
MLANVILTLLASASLVLAVPGGTSGYAPPPKETICTPKYFTTTSVGEGKTTYLSTKTVVIPITTVVEKPTTSVSGYPYTSTGYVTKVNGSQFIPEIVLTVYQTKTYLTTHLTTKTYSTVTTIVNTKVESDVKTDTKVETVPTSSVGTSYKTSVGNVKETVVTTKTSNSICTETAKVPITSVSTGTKTVCTTKGGY